MNIQMLDKWLERPLREAEIETIRHVR